MTTRIITIALVLILVCTSLHFISNPPDPQEKLTGHEDFTISLSAARELTKNFRQLHPESKILGEYFSADAVRKILDQNGCVGLRIYYASKLDGSLTLVLCGITSNNQDMVNGYLAENSFPCPPWCDESSSLKQ